MEWGKRVCNGRVKRVAFGGAGGNKRGNERLKSKQRGRGEKMGRGKGI